MFQLIRYYYVIKQKFGQNDILLFLKQKILYLITQKDFQF